MRWTESQSSVEQGAEKGVVWVWHLKEVRVEVAPAGIEAVPISGFSWEGGREQHRAPAGGGWRCEGLPVPAAHTEFRTFGPHADP